ncbi:hypothetical protein [Terracidiphilus gabretensis]|jgi:hypothetical protein|uniref:hypothetical protein n=1 Tax=Terracidiphilus gabretensis TaxID=1577687 RepID=UPI00071BFC3B|nr:hypothetical protein [Terracidiphilus gabretensis]
MKHLSLAPLVLATCCTFSVAAQQPDAPQPQPQPNAQSAPTAQSSQAAPGQPAQPEALALSPVTGELTSKLNSKTAKAGDKVELKTTEKATMADGTVIPKGSKIVGHVTEAQAYIANKDNGRVTLQFDQAEIKSGQSMPIKSAIQTVTPAGSSSMDASAAMPNSSSSSPQTSSGSAPNGTASPGTGAATAAGARSATENSSPGASPATNSTSGPAPGTTVARNGNVVIKTTAVPGVLIASSSSGQPFSNASGALLSARQDVQLDDGTKMVLSMATSSPGTGAAQR